MSAPQPDNQSAIPRWVQVTLAVILGVAAAGYLVGLSQPPRPRGVIYPAEAAPAPHVQPAVAYGERPAELGPNRDWSSSLHDLTCGRPGLLDPVQQSEDDRLAALAQRGSRRAFDGAPPTVPHSISQMSAANCLACHGEGLRVAERVAPKMSHQTYASCTQCHVESDNRALPPPRPLDNAFSGLAAPGAGERAGPGAPPTIPHSTWMRNDCLSCHGTLGAAGLRTTHPWRQSCTQCHAPSAALGPAAGGPNGGR